MIDLLVHSLRRAGVAFTIGELDNILWLASRLGVPPPVDVPPVPDQAQTDGDALLPDSAAPGGQGHDLADGGMLPAAPAPPESASIYPTPGPMGELNAGMLRVPGVAGTPGPAELRRALRPLAHCISSRVALTLDEDASAEESARSGAWAPVFRPLRERGFDLSIVIEDCTSAMLRARGLSELAANLRRDGVLRAVQVYRLTGTDRVRLSTESGAETGVDRLQSHGRRHLVLFATDGTSSRWRSGLAQAFVHALGATSAVSILHLLPRDAWTHTLVGEPDLLVHSARAGDPNSRMRYVLPRWLDPEDGQGALPVPVLGMDAAGTATWVRAMSAHGAASTPGVMVAPAPLPLDADEEPCARHGPGELVARYRQMASRAAYDLAVFLSPLDPLTIPVMRLVQRTMSPDGGDGELAEFILGGLVRPIAPDGVALDEPVYRFREGVGRELRRALRYSEEHTIRQQLRRVGQFLEAGAVDGAAFTGAFPAPAGKARLVEWALPFAEVSRDTLQRFIEPAMPALAAVPDARRRLSILHFSDLHMTPGYAHPAGPSEDAFDAPWRAILSEIVAQGPVDLVCVTGDLTWNAQPEEFDAAGAFLADTLATLGVGRERLFVVPGNHDLTRQAEKPAIPMHAPLKMLQASYRAWAARFLPHMELAGDATASDFQVRLAGWSVPVRIVGLDSSWISSASASSHDLYSAQLAKLAPRNGQELIVALAHHSPQATGAPIRIDSRLAESGVRLLMHGHAGAGASGGIENGTIMVHNAGSGLSEYHGGPPQFSLIELALDDPDGVTRPVARSYTWQRERGAWLHEPSPVRMPAPQEERNVPHFTGRERELGMLAACLAAGKATPDAPLRALILGQTGIGKTWLALAFAARHWTDADGKPLLHLLVSIKHAPPDRDAFLASLPVPERARQSLGALADYLRASSCLLILDDIDSRTAFDTIRDWIENLRGCPVLCAGHEQPPGLLASMATSARITVIQLDGLDADQGADYLARKNPAAAADRQDLQRIARALFGIPAALAIAATQLDDSRIVARLLHWIDMDAGLDAPEQKPDDARRFRALSASMEEAILARIAQWQHAKLEDNTWRVLPLLLAHAPLAGTTPSLAASITGMSLAQLQRFTDVLGERAPVGLRMSKTRIAMVPMWAMCGRAAAPEMGPVVMRRCGEWFARHLESSTRDQRNWAELDRARPALLEWLQACPPEAGALVRGVCVPYARTHGPLPAWRAFCQRMLALDAGNEQAASRWWEVIALLQADAIDGHGEPTPAADAGTEAGQAQALRPHQVAIAQEAIQASEAARRRDPRAGMVIQALGTGMTMSLLGYLKMRTTSPMLQGLCHLVVVDRVELCSQIADRYRHFMPDAAHSLFVPGHPRELFSLLGSRTSGVIVTTVQKLQRLPKFIDTECVVVYFALSAPNSAWMARFNRGSLLVFGHETLLLRPRVERDFGSVISTYLTGAAIRDGYLRPVTLDQPRLDGSRAHGEAALLDLVAARFEEAQGRRSKAVILAEDGAEVLRWRSALVKAGIARCYAMAAPMPRDARQRKVIEFNRAVDGRVVLVTTPVVAAGLYLHDVDTCYLLSRIPLPMMFKVESFVNRLHPQPVQARIVDLADNDWRGFDRARLRE